MRYLQLPAQPPIQLPSKKWLLYIVIIVALASAGAVAGIYYFARAARQAVEETEQVSEANATQEIVSAYSISIVNVLDNKVTVRNEGLAPVYTLKVFVDSIETDYMFVSGQLPIGSLKEIIINVPGLCTRSDRLLKIDISITSVEQTVNC